MRRFLIAPVVALMLAGAAQAAPMPNRPNVDDASFVEANGARVLKQSILIRTTREKAWAAFATTEGLLKWEAPVAAIELKVGGHLEASYDPKARLGDPGNIKHVVLGYLPGELMVFRNVQTPPGFKHPELFSQVVTIVQFEDAGPGLVKVTCSEVGYGVGPDWDELYAFFHGGNAYVLEMLKAHLEGTDGPKGPAH